jgi:hypothetical protein
VGAERGSPPPSPSPTKQSTDKLHTRLARERGHPYWQDEKVLAFFEEIRKLYPRTLDRGQEMEAWRKTVGDRLSTGVDVAIWDGLQAWLALWKKEGTEMKFIPHFATWINGERWDSVPKGVTS